jgi:hypothetical protein
VTQVQKHSRAAQAAQRSATPRNQKSKPIADPAFLDPADLPDQYARRVAGDCMAPAIKHGDAVIVDKRLPFKAGDLVVIYMRPELVAPGEIGIYLKRLALGVPPYVKLPHKEHPDSNVAALIIAEQDNPRRQYAIRADRILAMHRCLGLASTDVRLVHPSKVAAGFTDDDVKRGLISTRRDFLRVASLAGAALAVPSLALAAGEPDPIFAAIEVHRAAEAAFGSAIRELDDLEERLSPDVMRQARVPIVFNIGPDVDPNNLPPDTKVRWCRDAEEIEATLPAWASAENRKAALEAALAGLEKDRRELELARETCGLTAMQAARDSASAAADDAALAILDTHPTTEAGVVALLTYAADYTKGGVWPSNLFDDDEIKHNPRFPNEPGRDWSFYLHRMLAKTLTDMAAR